MEGIVAASMEVSPPLMTTGLSWSRTGSAEAIKRKFSSLQCGKEVPPQTSLA